MLVLASAVIASVAGVVAKLVESKEPDAVHVVALALGLMGFLAIASAADVLARSIAAAAKINAKRVESASLTPFAVPPPATRSAAGPDPDVTVLAAAGGDQTYLLVQQGDALAWVPAGEVKIGAAKKV